ncbi:MAG: hypothetical protein KF823_03025 [Xanthomonadales bacterium]|nr:hypothetical protein [Xanthomonadales bacterium]
MRSPISTLFGLAVLAGASAASAAPVPGSGGGYYGTAWFNTNQGIVVGAYPTWAECNYYFQQALNLRVNDWGWTVTEINPCSYRPPFGRIRMEREHAFAIDPSSPEESLQDANRVLDALREVRNRYRADEYEAELDRIR